MVNTRATTAARAAKKEAMAAAAAAGADDEVACGDDEQAEVTAITLQDFIDIGAEIMDKSPPSLLKSKRATTTETFESRWVSFFNAEPEVCLDVWNRLKGQSFDGILDGGEPMHLLWACFFYRCMLLRVSYLDHASVMKTPFGCMFGGLWKRFLISKLRW
jgi:hypothetical protein